MNPHVCTKFLAFALLLVVAIPTTGLAEWREADCTIMTLAELNSQLSAATTGDVSINVSQETPVIFPPGFDPTVPADVLAALPLSGLAAKREGADIQVRAPRPLVDHIGVTDRAYPASIATIDTGNPAAIGSGVVSLYGRLIEGPFLIESDINGVTLNGVRVLPVPGPRTPPPSPTVAQRDLHSGLKTAMDQYKLDMVNLSADEARQRYITSLESLPDVRSAEWTSDDLVMLERQNGRKQYISFDPAFDRGDPPTPDEWRAYHEMEAENFRRMLRADRAVLFGATYILPVSMLDGPSFKRRVLEIRVSSEDESLKLARIQAYTARRDAAADLLLGSEGGGR